MKIEGETRRLEAHMADLAGSSFRKVNLRVAL